MQQAKSSKARYSNGFIFENCHDLNRIAIANYLKVSVISKVRELKWITRVPMTIKREKQAGRFILATNVLEQDLLNSAEILSNYKNQQSCERGFRFLKDPVFFADSLFVENPQRVETMLFVMTLCLLVYNLGKREIRKNLQRAKVGIKNQVDKLTNHPTLRRIFQCFKGIHAVVINGVKQIVNLTDERQFILNFLPSSCQKYYL